MTASNSATHLSPAPRNCTIAQWFDAISDNDVHTLEKLYADGVSPDCLHPLHQTTALMEATRLGRTAIAAWLITHGATPALLCGLPKGSALHCALRRHQWAITDLLLSHIPHAALRDSYGATPLHALCLNAQDDKEAEILCRYARLLISKHCPIDATDHDGTTALHHSVMNNAYLLTEELLQQGANVNALIPCSGVSALMIAALDQNRKMARLLLRHGANSALCARDGTSPASSFLLSGLS